ncbi:MAG: hypothetical protein ACNS60_03920 [Candidatus Cyclobacteriaceae bacterium M2_1C_046]
MNKFIFLLSFILLISTAKAQSLSCSDVKNGTYIINNSPFKNNNYIIQRSDNRQVEIDKKGNKYIFEVEWINTCHYKLKLQEYIPSSTNFSYKGSTDIIIVEILKVDKEGYKQRSSTIKNGYLFSRTTWLSRENPTIYNALDLMH